MFHLQLHHNLVSCLNVSHLENKMNEFLWLTIVIEFVAAEKSLISTFSTLYDSQVRHNLEYDTHKWRDPIDEALFFNFIADTYGKNNKGLVCIHQCTASQKSSVHFPSLHMNSRSSSITITYFN